MGHLDGVEMASDRLTRGRALWYLHFFCVRDLTALGVLVGLQAENVLKAVEPQKKR